VLIRNRHRWKGPQNEKWVMWLVSGVLGFVSGGNQLGGEGMELHKL
jgi:hypothetical protein